MQKLNINNILFLDVETVPQYENWGDVPIEMQKLYKEKTKYQRKDKVSAKDFYPKAGIWSEFGKIICISVGHFVKKDEQNQFRVTSFCSKKECDILKRFKSLINSHFNLKKHLLCAHNGKEFDFPYIARRMIINKIKLPEKLNLFGKKPWEVPHLDTLELWKFGDYKHYTSLKLLTYVLGIPSPKQDIEGGEVYRVYYKEKDLNRIAKYCERDTIAVAQLLLRFNGLPLIEEENIVVV